MASSKELFKKGLDYQYTMIINCENDLQEVTEALGYAPAGRYRNLLENKKNDLKAEIERTKKQMKLDIQYFGYSESDLQGKFKPMYMSEEELAKDWEQIMSEASGDPNLSPEVAQMIAGE